LNPHSPKIQEADAASPLDEGQRPLEVEASVPTDSMEEKVRNLHTKLMYQEFELNQLKAKFKTNVETTR
jgi:hypothetical protein